MCHQNKNTLSLLNMFTAHMYGMTHVLHLTKVHSNNLSLEEYFQMI